MSQKKSNRGLESLFSNCDHSAQENIAATNQPQLPPAEMTCTRVITYQGTISRVDEVLEKSLKDGTYDFGRIIVTVRTIEIVKRHNLKEPLNASDKQADSSHEDHTDQDPSFQV